MKLSTWHDKAIIQRFSMINFTWWKKVFAILSYKSLPLLMCFNEKSKGIVIDLQLIVTMFGIPNTLTVEAQPQQVDCSNIRGQTLALVDHHRFGTFRAVRDAVAFDLHLSPISWRLWIRRGKATAGQSEEASPVADSDDGFGEYATPPLRSQTFSQRRQ